MDRIKDFGLIGLAILSLVIFGYCKIVMSQRDEALTKIELYKSQITEQNTAITKWKDDALEKDKKLKVVENSLRVKSLQSQKRTQSLMLEEVPVGCTDAAKWAAIQATRMGLD